MFELVPGNQNVDGQTEGCWTHQSKRQVGCMQSAQKGQIKFIAVQIFSHGQVFGYALREIFN